MEVNFETQIDLMDSGGIKELLIAQKSRYFEIMSDEGFYTALCKIKDDTWNQLQGNHPQEVVDHIGEAIDKKLACCQANSTTSSNGAIL